MALNETLGIKVVFGGIVGASFSTALTRAIGDVGKLTKEIDALNRAAADRKDNAGKLDAAKIESDEAEAKRKTAKDALLLAREDEKRAEREALHAKRIAERKKATKSEKDDAIRLAEAARLAADATSRAAINETRAKEQAVERAKAYKKITSEEARREKILGNADDAGIVKRLGALNAQKNYAEAREKLKQSKDDLGSLWRSTVVWTSAISGALSAATFKIAKSVADTADNAGGLADRLGMTTRALQEMQYAGLQSNLAVEDTNELLGKMQLRLREAYMSGGDAADALRRLRLDSASLAYMSPDEAVMEISRALQSVPNASDRAALAVKILGKEGAKMANMLAAGPVELARLREEANSTGFVLGDDAVREGRLFDAAMKKLGATMDGVRNVIGSGMLPAFTGLLGALSGVLLDNMEFFKDTAKLLGDVVRASAPTLVFFAKALAAIGHVVKWVVEPIFRIADAVGAWPVLFGFIIGAGGYMVINRLWGVAKGVWGVVVATRALAASNAAGGVTGILAGQAAGAAAGTAVVVSNLSLGTRLWVGLLGGMGALLRWGGAFIGLLQGVVNILGTVRFFLIGLGSSLWGAIGSFFAGIGTWIMGALSTAGSAILAFFGTLAGTIVAVIGTAVGSFFAGRWITQWLTGFKWVRAIIDGVGAAVWWVGDQFDKLSASVGKFWEKLKGAPAGIWSRIKGMFGGDDSTNQGGAKPGEKSASIFGSAVTPAPASASQVSSRSAASAAQSAAPVTITVNAAPGQSEDAIARKTAALIESRNRRTQSGSFAAA